MNIRVTLLLLCSFIFLTIVAVFFLKIEKEKAEPLPPPQLTEPLSELIADSKKYTSADGTFSFEYPADWKIQDTTPVQGFGQFGPYIESWMLTNVPPVDPGQGGIATDSVKIDFELMQNRDNPTLDTVVPCEMKTSVCELVTINNRAYKKSTARLNIGNTVIVVGRIYNNKIFRASALIANGSQLEANTTMVERIIASFQSTE